jgi:hypothetical protein
MSARTLQSEKRFYVLVGNLAVSDKILRIIESYTIMSAHIQYDTSFNIPTIDVNEFGTFCHIDTEANIQNMITAISSKGLRYIGYVNGTDYILSIGVNGYVGIPVKTDKILIPDGMWEVSYPHITLAPPMGSNKFNEFKEMIGQEVKYSISELIKTKSTYSQSGLIMGEEHHVTRIVLNGQKPFIAKREMESVRGTTYEDRIGYPVIM